MEKSGESGIDRSDVRVKVYVLSGERVWDDKGTGYVTFDDGGNEPLIIVKAEAPEHEGLILLRSTVLRDTTYQKQQETLIVWSESGSTDLALSFQEAAGCDRIWRRICEFQGKDPLLDCTGVDEGSEDENIDERCPNSGNILFSGGRVVLPRVDASMIGELAEHLTRNVQQPITRKAIGEAMERADYIPKLTSLFRELEAQRDFDKLRQLYTVFKCIFMLDHNALLETLFSDDNIESVVGALEYDIRLVGEEKYHHRDYLWREAQFKQVCGITDEELLRRIHQTYRAQYILDVVLPAPSIFEENLFNSLNHFIYLQRLGIVHAVVHESNLLNDFFERIRSSELASNDLHEAVMFLKELCSFARTLEMSSNAAFSEANFFKRLLSMGLLSAMMRCLSEERYEVRAAAIDILALFVEHNPFAARYAVLLVEDEEEEASEKPLLQLIAAQLWEDEDVELSCGNQVLTVLKNLADPPLPAQTFSVMRVDRRRTEFLALLYNTAMEGLCAPLVANTASGKLLRDDYRFTVAQSALCDFLMHCCENHTHYARTLMTTELLLDRILVLLQSRHAFLRLTALRLFRRVVSLKSSESKWYTRHIVTNDLFAPIVAAYKRNGHKYNLFNSALLELFEFIRSENLCELIIFVGDNYLDEFADVDYVQTFSLLRRRYTELINGQVETDEDDTEQSYSGSNTNDALMEMSDDISDDEDEKILERAKRRRTRSVSPEESIDAPALKRQRSTSAPPVSVVPSPGWKPLPGTVDMPVEVFEDDDEGSEATVETKVICVRTSKSVVVCERQKEQLVPNRSLVEYDSTDSEGEERVGNRDNDKEQLTPASSPQRRLTDFVVDAETEKGPLQEVARQEHAAAVSAALDKALDGASATTTITNA